MAAGRQLRLLLWKDYLIRKRKLITLAGIVWATLVMLCLYAVRANVDNQDFSTCQFPARAMPSAGILTFLQSFVCSINNECSPMENYEEIPAYENSKLSRIQRNIAPLLNNETVVEAASAVPNVLKILATVAEALDDPQVIHISSKGLKVKELFRAPDRVKRYIVSQMNMTDTSANAVLDAGLSIQGILQGDINRCNVKSVSALINIADTETLGIFVSQLCLLTDKEIQKMATDLLLEINFSKYIKMIGDIYYKLSGDARISTLGDLITAVLRLTRIDSFLPQAVTTIFTGRQVEFTYFNVSIFKNFINYFEPVFGSTQTFMTIRDISDTIAMGFEYLDAFSSQKINNPTESAANFVLTQVYNEYDSYSGIVNVTNTFKNAINTIESSQSTIDPFQILSQITNFIMKLLPERTKHEVLFYSTLLAKLIEGANTVVAINYNIQQMAFDVSKKNPEGVIILRNLPIHIVRKGYEALGNTEKIQILTSKLNLHGQIFCETSKLAEFFTVSLKEAITLKTQFCTDSFKNYVSDLVKSFGIYDVRDLINNMASLVIQETFGKDTSEQLYSIDKDVQILKNFTQSVIKAKAKQKVALDWNLLFNVSDDSQFIKVFENRENYGKQILITVHGALAKEVVKQNSILELKISPILQDLTAIVSAINTQISLTSAGLVVRMKNVYPKVIETMLLTLKNENLTYKSLSTPNEAIVCEGIDIASSYLDMSTVEDKSDLVSTLCDISRTIDAGLRNDSNISKAFASVKSSTHSIVNVNWTKLINEIKNLYIKLDKDYPYLFEFSTYGMDRHTQIKIENMLKEAKQFWFSMTNMERGLRLSIKIMFRFLDLLDSEAFHLNNEVWLKMKHACSSTTGALNIIDDLVRLLVAASRNETISSDLPPTTVKALSTVIFNLPYLVIDIIDKITTGDIDAEPIVSVINADTSWPCSNLSISEIIPFNTTSKNAIKAFETLMCMDKSFQEEWVHFIRNKNIKKFNSTQWNTTTFEPHMFLKFSRTFETLINDIIIVKGIFDYFMNESLPPDNQIAIIKTWKYADDIFKKTDENTALRILFTKIDYILNSLTTASQNESLNILWDKLKTCSNDSYIEGNCKDTWRAVWKYSLEAFSVIVDNLASDLITYFTEITDSDANFLQMVGFNKETGIYKLYEKLPEFIGVLLNSYWDYGFMTQIRRASHTEFWECEAVLEALRPPPGSPINDELITKVKPFVCPTLLHWLSMPRGDNTFLDLVAKPQHTIFTQQVQRINSSFENAYIKIISLTNLITKIAHKNESWITETDTYFNSLKMKLMRTVDNILKYQINETDVSYRLFNEINKKQFISASYLTRITLIVNKIAIALENFNIEDIKADLSEEDVKLLVSDLSKINTIFKRRPNEALALHFDIITYVLSNNDKDFNIRDGFIIMCSDLNNNDTSKDILIESQRTKSQFCARNYKTIYKNIENIIGQDLQNAKRSFNNVMKVLQESHNNETGMITIFSKRKKLLNALKTSTKYAYDLGLPIYLKYLQNNLQNYNVVLSFLSGRDWWSELRMLYNRPHINTFFDGIEQSFEIAMDILNNLDKIQLVRLLRDINLNNTESFCRPNVTLSDYVPDATGVLSQMKESICSSENSEVLKEIPALVFASQGYSDELTINKEIDYSALDSIIDESENRINIISDAPVPPQRPAWITDEKLDELRNTSMGLLSKETMTKVVFGILGNIIDSGTLYLNNSQCKLCSRFTTWVKQISLQLYKKQEYDNLLCHLHTMTMYEIHHTLKSDFHWDMAFRELISSRNYTKFELNKSLNELLQQIKLFVLDDSASDRVAACLASKLAINLNNSTHLGYAALFFTLLAEVSTLFRAELPYLQEVEGIKDVSFFQKLQKQVAPRLDAFVPVKKYLVENKTLSMELTAIIDDRNLIVEIMNSNINLHMFNNEALFKYGEKYFQFDNHNTLLDCLKYNCEEIIAIVNRNINTTLLENDLLTLQYKEFWSLNFMSNILYHVENLLRHIGRLLSVFSNHDLKGIINMKMSAIIDLVMDLISEDTLNVVVTSIHGILVEAQPLLQNTTIDTDLRIITSGLQVLYQYKTYLINQNIKVSVSEIFSQPERIEQNMNALGINRTNFWSISAPRLQLGHLQLTPILSWKRGVHINNFVCEEEAMSRVLIPGGLDVVSMEEVLGFVVDQFCDLPDNIARQIVPALLEGLNLRYILEKLGSVAISQVYNASGIDNAEGARTVAALPQLVAVLPEVGEPLRRAVNLLVDDPLMDALRNYSSISGLLASSDVMSSAGELVCGKPFAPQVSRVYRNVLQSTDHAVQPDQDQLDLLPTDFCRSLYKEIIGVQGGKIVWSFVKPLVMGKLLYTPDTPTVNAIIRQANRTFEHMSRMAAVVHALAGALPSAEQLVDHRDGLTVLQSLLQIPALRSIILPDGNLPDFQSGDDMLNQFDNLQDASRLVSKASSLLRCINLDRFHATPNEEEMTKVAARLANVDELSAGLVFLKSNIDHEIFDVEYKIRMDIDNVPTTARLKNFLWIPGPESSFLEHLRYFRGFVQIQDLLGSALLRLATNRSQSFRTKRDVVDELDQDFVVYTQQMPYPCYKKDFFQTSLYESQALIVAFFFSLLFSVASATRFLVTDVESGNIMLLCVMGISMNRSTLSWLFWSLLELTATAASMTAVLTLGQVLPNTDPTLVFTLLLIFSCSVLSFCYMISKLSSRAGLAAVGAAVAYLVTFMPVVVLLALEAEITTLCKLLVCVFMSSSLSYAFLNIARWEAMGLSVGWSQFWDSPTDYNDVTIGLAAIMMLLDALLYLVVGWTIDYYFGVKSIRSHMSYVTSSQDKAGVSVVGVAKCYGSKTALSGVSLELRRGQVTALLGHNGAGKTTLLKILTGTLKPSSGQVVLRSNDGAQHVALCPQRDVLYESLTTHEHLVLYARLRSPNDVAAQRDVDTIERVLSLDAWSSRPVSQLSGGTRRRVCVALAFIGPSELVALDEPTAGVDAKARREIWSMIERLRPDRTVLLTTHHLDEAALLSDNLVILHKGRINTTGSPAEIKRALGRGYRLSVHFQALGGLPSFSAGRGVLAQRLTALAQNIIPNVQLERVNPATIDLQVPFYDHHGLNNNLLELCELLETNQEALGFTDYSLDCDGLEQVLHDICQETDEPSKLMDYESEECVLNWGTNSKHGSSTPLTSEIKVHTSRTTQLWALLTARYLHFIRNRASWGALWLLPGVFVLLALAFALVRPPPDNERALPLQRGLYNNTDFIAPDPSRYSGGANTVISQRVLESLVNGREARNWTEKDTPSCQCGETRQICQDHTGTNSSLPQTMVLPDVATLNQWLINTQQRYIQNRYLGFTSSSNNRTTFVVWYNNKGHHALPSAITTLYQAALRAVTHPTANLTVYSHPMKISAEQLSKDTVYQHVADAGISGLVVVAYCLAGAALAAYGVTERASGSRHLQLLCGMSPALCCIAATIWDMLLIVINMAITAILMEAFQYPVFVDRNNLAAICLLILLYGFACGSLMHLAENIFSDPGVANMLLFCGNALLGLGGLTVLLILDLISESERTDNARWVLHKIFLVAPPFALGDGLLEIAKNTIQAQVLSRFGMETYKDPLQSDLVVYHYIYLLVVGSFLFLLNLAIEYHYFELLLHKWFSPKMPTNNPEDTQPPAVVEEAHRVRAAFTPALRLSTIGRVYAGYKDAETQKHNDALGAEIEDVAACLSLSKIYRNSSRPALNRLTLGFPGGQCTALVGENGAGKSTVFGLLTGRLRPTAGQVMLAASAASRRKLAQGLLSYCPQSNALDPLLTVVETLTLHCQLRGINNRHMVIATTLRTLALEKYSHTRAGALSGGTQRRLCAALAFLGRSPLVLLDEPTSGMDPVSRACVSRGVHAACRSGRAVLLSAHRAADVAPAARAATLHDGRLIALNAPRSFGYTIECRVRECIDGKRSAAEVWARMKSQAPHSQLLVLHRRVILALLPAYYVVDGAEVQTRPSTVLKLMAELQAASDIEDFTISQSSIDQIAMLNSKSEELLLPPEVLPTRRLSENLDSVTSL